MKEMGNIVSKRRIFEGIGGKYLKKRVVNIAGRLIE